MLIYVLMVVFFFIVFFLFYHVMKEQNEWNTEPLPDDVVEKNKEFKDKLHLALQDVKQKMNEPK